MSTGCSSSTGTTKDAQQSITFHVISFAKKDIFLSISDDKYLRMQNFQDHGYNLIWHCAGTTQLHCWCLCNADTGDIDHRSRADVLHPSSMFLTVAVDCRPKIKKTQISVRLIRLSLCHIGQCHSSNVRGQWWLPIVQYSSLTNVVFVCDVNHLSGPTIIMGFCVNRSWGQTLLRHPILRMKKWLTRLLYICLKCWRCRGHSAKTTSRSVTVEVKYSRWECLPWVVVLRGYL